MRDAPRRAGPAPLPPAGRGGPADARAVGFRVTDGAGLRGRGRSAVVLAHMGNRIDSEADWYPPARRLARSTAANAPPRRSRT